MKFRFFALPLALLILSGCGGGSGLSGPNSNTQQGLGTLIVKVTNADDSSVSDRAAIVSLDKGVKVVRDGKAIFYDLKPGRYFVEARSQSISLPGDSRNVDIEADKTLTITLKLSAFVAPTNPNSPFPRTGE